MRKFFEKKNMRHVCKGKLQITPHVCDDSGKPKGFPEIKDSRVTYISGGQSRLTLVHILTNHARLSVKFMRHTSTLAIRINCLLTLYYHEHTQVWTKTGINICGERTQGNSNMQEWTQTRMSKFGNERCRKKAGVTSRGMMGTGSYSRNNYEERNATMTACHNTPRSWATCTILTSSPDED